VSVLEALGECDQVRGVGIGRKNFDEPRPVEELVLEREVGQQSLGHRHRLLQGQLGRGRRPTQREADDVRDATEVLDRLTEQVGPLVALARVVGEFLAGGIGARLADPRAGGGCLLRGQTEQGIELRDELGVLDAHGGPSGRRLGQGCRTPAPRLRC
jgi:hypothetical protein